MRNKRREVCAGALFVVGLVCASGANGAPPAFEYSNRTIATQYGSNYGIGDLNGDGWDDIVLTRTDNGGWRGLYSQSGVSYSVGSLYGRAGYTPRDLAVVDVENNGNEDLIFSALDSILVARSNGTDSWSIYPYYTDPEGRQANAIAEGDFDGDGLEDIVVAWGTGLRIMYSTGSFGLAWGPFFDDGDGFGQIVTADINDDGMLDVAGISGENLSVVYTTPSGDFGQRVDYSLDAVASSSFTLAAGDLDNDGRPDLAVASLDPGFPQEVGYVPASELILLRSLPGGSLGDEQRFCCFRGTYVAIADLNSDGWNDVVLTYGGPGLIIPPTLRFFYNNEGQGFATADAVLSSRAEAIYAGTFPHDLNRDGALDLLVPTWQPAGPHRQYVLENSTAATLTRYIAGGTPTYWVDGDDDGDYDDTDYKSQVGVILGDLWHLSHPVYRFALPNPSFATAQREIQSITVSIYGKGRLGSTADVSVGGLSPVEISSSEGLNEFSFDGQAARDLLVQRTSEAGEPTWYLDVSIIATDPLDWYDLRDVTLTYRYADIDPELLARHHQVLAIREMVLAFADFHQDYLASGGIVLAECGKVAQAVVSQQAVAQAESALPGEWGKAVSQLRSNEVVRNFARRLAPDFVEALEYNRWLSPFSIFQWWGATGGVGLNVNVSQDFPADLQQADAALLSLAAIYANAATGSGDLVGLDTQLTPAVQAAVDEIRDIVEGVYTVGVLVAMQSAYAQNPSDAAADAASGYVDALASIVRVDNFDISAFGQPNQPVIDVINSPLTIQANILEKQIESAPNSAPTNVYLSSSALSENLPAGTAVGSFSTQDADEAETFVYTIRSGDPNGDFTVAGNSLQTSQPLDYENVSEYSLRVRSADSGGLYFEKDFPVQVVDVSDSALDSDLDGVPDDGDMSGLAGDTPCPDGSSSDCDDNCRYRANITQADSNGDGAGDACQCGDFTGDGFVNVADLAAYTGFFGGTLATFDRDRCGVSPNNQTGGCDGSDFTVLRRFVDGLSPPVTNSCAAFLGP